MPNNENPPGEGSPSENGTEVEAETAGNGAAVTPLKPPESAEDRQSREGREKADLQDRYLRLAADFENYKRRARQDIGDAAHRGREALMRELLTPLDNLERALATASGGSNLESLVSGLRMVEKQFRTALEKFDVKPFDALGQPFDPAKHEAIQQVETSAVPHGAVANVFARGYTLGDRLLRPAMVAVAKAPPPASPPPADAEALGDADLAVDESDGGDEDDDPGSGAAGG